MTIIHYNRPIQKEMKFAYLEDENTNKTTYHLKSRIIHNTLNLHVKQNINDHSQQSKLLQTLNFGLILV